MERRLTSWQQVPQQQPQVLQQPVLHTGRSNNRRNREIAAINRRAIFWQCNHRYMDRLADIDTGQINRDTVRNRVARHHHFNRMEHQIHRATALDARRSSMVDHMNRHIELDLLACREAQKVNMHREILHRIHLVITGNGACGCSIDIDFKNRRQKMTGKNQLARDIVIKRDRSRSRAAAIDNRRNLTSTTKCTGGPLATLRPARRLDLLYSFRHCSHPSKVKPPERGPTAVHMRPCLQGCLGDASVSYRKTNAETISSGKKEKAPADTCRRGLQSSRQAPVSPWRAGGS